MNIFSRIADLIGRAFRRMIPYSSIEQAEKIETPISKEMTAALQLWYSMYTDNPPWKVDGKVLTQNLPAMVCSEISRQITLEMEWSISGTEDNTKNGELIESERAKYLRAEFEKLMRGLRQKVEHGLAAGGMLIKPYPNPNDGHIYFDFVMDWSIYPIAFDDDGNLMDVVLPDIMRDGNTIYTRLERHRVVDGNVEITQRAFKSSDPKQLGEEISLKSVPKWDNLQPSVTIANAGGNLFGWYKVPSANNVDLDSPMGASIFSKAVNTIRDADMQYSRLNWEFEAGEIAINADASLLHPTDNNGKKVAQLNDRLYRSVSATDDDFFEVFAPQLRDNSIINGLNQMKKQVEDLTGLARGTLSDVDASVRTATELRIVKERSYATVSDNQTALEYCLRDVVRAMDVYSTLYNMAPPGGYILSFEWADSIISDTSQQLKERIMLAEIDAIGKAELRQWYLGETEAEANAAIMAIQAEKKQTGGEDLPQII